MPESTRSLEVSVVVMTAIAAREVGTLAQRILRTLDSDQAGSGDLPMSGHVDHHQLRYVIAARGVAAALAIPSGLLAAPVTSHSALLVDPV